MAFSRGAQRSCLRCLRHDKVVQEVALLSWDSGTQSKVPNHEGAPAFFVVLNKNNGPSPRNILSVAVTSFCT